MDLEQISQKSSKTSKKAPKNRSFFAQKRRFWALKVQKCMAKVAVFCPLVMQTIPIRIRKEVCRRVAEAAVRHR